MLLSLILVIISQCMCISKHKLVNYTSVHLGRWREKPNNTPKNYKNFPWTITSITPMKFKYPKHTVSEWCRPQCVVGTWHKRCKCHRRWALGNLSMLQEMGSRKSRCTVGAGFWGMCPYCRSWEVRKLRVWMLPVPQEPNKSAHRKQKAKFL